MLILNLCDYKDDSKNIYYNELLKYFDNTMIDSIPFDINSNPAEILISIMTQNYDLIVGHGFGGVLAVYLGMVTKTRTILINPSYPASRYWNNQLSNYKYKQVIEKNIQNAIVWLNKKEDALSNIHIILGRDDDITDTSTTNKYFVECNCLYVDEGHWPIGEDFSKIFKNLVLEDSAENDCKAYLEKQKDTETYNIFKNFAIGKKDYSLLYLYTYGEESLARMSRVARCLCNNTLEDNLNGKMKYMTFDQLEDEISKVKEKIKAVSFLVIDHVTGMLLTENTKKCFWSVCKDILDNNGRVLILSDEEGQYLFEGDRTLLDLIYSGYNAFFEDDNYSRVGKSISIDGKSIKPDSSIHRVIIDELDTKHGNIVIKWHSSELQNQILYVYFKDGNWYIDNQENKLEKNIATIVLEKACAIFVEKTTVSKYDGHNFF
ncbi:YqiA/YcfP family alpha/beta fold hydrolase [Pseudobutyrivibrio sp. MD2005]|uniref:YqiA/YcfP family alpha/beta fold hydrolase n=1 Tax=Pseudobutyrivibrio sp. MD2005 TaxID=1410616 RepID=UPI0004883530|nr:YqiA/YcfP family alpha/beta fold hydrolase [Pseudobutyrivibrio sp. MD2005]